MTTTIPPGPRLMESRMELLGVSMAEVARRIDVHRSTVMRWLDYRAVPARRTRGAIAAVLGDENGPWEPLMGAVWEWPE